MKFHTKPFEIIITNKENSLLWGQKMWFILTDIYQNRLLDKLKTHELWIENITLALIYKEFTIVAFENKEPINWGNYLDNLQYNWDDFILAYMAGRNHFRFSDIENFNKTKRYNLIIKLIYKNKEDVFYTLVKHFGTSNAMFEEIKKSAINQEGKLPDNHDDMWAWEWAREMFQLPEIEIN